MQANEKTANMKSAMFVGAIAGTTPLMINLIGVDAQFILDHFQPNIFIGYLIKAAGLMLLGAFVVFVNSEQDLKKAFQLGVMAPAFVLGAMNADNYNETRNELNQLQEELDTTALGDSAAPQTPLDAQESLTFRFQFIPAAHAKPALIGRHNQQDTSKFLWYGITGKVSEAWFVIVGTHKTEAAAQQQAKSLKERNFDARVYPPFKKNQPYAVAIGAYLSLRDARKLKKLAIKTGLSDDDTRLWKWTP